MDFHYPWQLNTIKKEIPTTLTNIILEFEKMRQYSTI
jgi:hypothetical protein